MTMADLQTGALLIDRAFSALSAPPENGGTPKANGPDPKPKLYKKIPISKKTKKQKITVCIYFSAFTQMVSHNKKTIQVKVLCFTSISNDTDTACLI